MEKPFKTPHYVMLIDDDGITNLIHQSLISRYDPHIELQAYNDARHALNTLVDQQKNDPASLPELILLDINMPGMNAWEFLEAYQAEGLSCYLMILTSSIDKRDRDKAAQYPAVRGFIVKPLSRTDLDALLR
ncbi:MAG: response regulator [Bacteroidia bacterium]